MAKRANNTSIVRVVIYLLYANNTKHTHHIKSRQGDLCATNYRNGLNIRWKRCSLVRWHPVSFRFHSSRGKGEGEGDMPEDEWIFVICLRSMYYIGWTIPRCACACNIYIFLVQHNRDDEQQNNMFCQSDYLIRQSTSPANLRTPRSLLCILLTLMCTQTVSNLKCSCAYVYI